MAQSSFFYCTVSSAAQEYANERMLSMYSGIDFQDKDAKIRLNQLNLKITTHKLILSNNPALDKLETNAQDNYVYFIIKICHITEIAKRYTGIISKTLDHINITTPGRVVQLFAKNLEGPYIQIEGALQKQDWKDETLKEKAIVTSGYQGMKQEIQQKEKLAQTTQSTIQSTFKGDFNDLFKNAQELQEISQYLKNSLSKNESNDDVNQILSNMGCFQIITKDESGDQYYDELAKQIFKMCSELFPKMGGMVSMIDAYYYFNKKRAISLVSPDEILKACSQFQRLNLQAKIAIYDNIKVVESTQYDYEKDYANTFGKYLTIEQGFTAEQLSKKLALSVMVIRIKLKNAIKVGKVCVDNRIEGIRYYQNIFTTL